MNKRESAQLCNSSTPVNGPNIDRTDACMVMTSWALTLMICEDGRCDSVGETFLRICVGALVASPSYVACGSYPSPT